MSTLLPIIRQMHDADGDRERAAVLLAVPDLVLIKYRPEFEAACRRAGFDAGLRFIDFRRAALHATRGPDGLLRDPKFDEVRAAFADYARGGAP